MLNTHSLELGKYVINGLFATAIHYAVLTFNLEVLEFSSAALANTLAAVFGIASSFLGSRYFVFSKAGGTLTSHAVKFGVLYASIAVMHGLVLLIWTDWLALDYRAGFLIATGLQVSLSYLGNKLLVFI